jgi:hypothetical protein
MISYDLFFKSFNPILVHLCVYLGAYFLETLYMIFDKSYLFIYTDDFPAYSSYTTFFCLRARLTLTPALRGLNYKVTQPYVSMKILNYCCKIKNKSLEELLMSNMLK